jgi:hypothetical protein
VEEVTEGLTTFASKIGGRVLREESLLATFAMKLSMYNSALSANEKSTITLPSLTSKMMTASGPARPRMVLIIARNSSTSNTDKFAFKRRVMYTAFGGLVESTVVIVGISVVAGVVSSVVTTELLVVEPASVVLAVAVVPAAVVPVVTAAVVPIAVVPAAVVPAAVVPTAVVPAAVVPASVVAGVPVVPVVALPVVAGAPVVPVVAGTSVVPVVGGGAVVEVAGAGVTETTELRV